MRKDRKKLLWTAGISAAAFAAVCLGGCTSQVQVPDTIKVQTGPGESRVIKVTGREEVKVVPDMTEIRYAVYTQADTAADCQKQNGEELAKTIETLKELGVEEKSIQTSSYGMNPIYDWNSGQEITGYEMTTQLTVSGVPVENAGELLSRSVQSGVNRIDSVSYFSSKYDESYNEALKGALAVAKTKAQALAEASGKTLGDVVNVEEYGYNPDVRYGVYANYSASNEAAAADMAVMPGEVSVEAEITVEFAIQ